jgi:transposase InsO family protein
MPRCVPETADPVNVETALRAVEGEVFKLTFEIGLHLEQLQPEHLGVRDGWIGPAVPDPDREEFYRMLEGVVIDDTQLFNDRLQEWERFYNFERPHGGLGGQTPYERLRQRTGRPM